MAKPGKDRLTVEVSLAMKRRAEFLARFSSDGTLTAFVNEALQEKIDREWPALEPRVRVMMQMQEDTASEEVDQL